jgi:Spy/CpxP family protein refolding chaperone
MLKIATAGLTALFITASPLAYAQAPGAARGPQQPFNAAEMGALTDVRINIVKAALQLTPEQQKFWPAIEDAIRARAKDRQARLASVERTVGEARSNPLEALRDRNPIEFMQRRAEAWTQRTNDLKKLADAWQPLYQTLTPEQKKRMGELALLVIRETRDTVERRRLGTD